MTAPKSWVAGANDPATDFPLPNLPYGVFSVDGDEPRCGVAIGGCVLDLAALEAAGILAAGGEDPVFELPFLNEFMELGPAAWARVRSRLTALLSEGAKERRRVEPHVVAMERAQLHLPFVVAGYTDFYSGRHHAQNVGEILRGAPDLPPNWLHLPIGYNGRASTVVVSGTAVRRPLGQTLPPDAIAPVFGPTRRLDFELELGAVVGTGSDMGTPVTVAEAEAMIFGYVLLNDWSARDIQAWEYQPLGPFQAKAFATTVSPWIVPAAALAPFRTTGQPRGVAPLPYLVEPGPLHHDVVLEVTLRPAGAARATTVTRTNARELSFSAPQQLAHHAIGGCAMQTGDLLGSGTISGPEAGGRGSMLERSWGGRDPLTLETGETRAFLEDGDTVTLTGWARGDGFRIGFGACEGTILPAPDFSV